MDFQLVIVLLCVVAALVFMGLRFWRIWQRRNCCACSSEKDPASPVCAACIRAGKLEDLRTKD